MLYRTITKYRFDATKACLAKAAPGAVTGSRSLLDALNYGSHFPGFQPKVRISAKRGYRLPAATSPLYTRQPEAASQLLERYTPAPQDSTAEEIPPPPAAATPEPPAFLDEEPVVARRMPRMTAPLVSGIVAIAIAAGVGLAIGHANSFKLRTQDHSTASGLISIAPAAVTPDNANHNGQAAIAATAPVPLPPIQEASGTENVAPPASSAARELTLAPDLDKAKNLSPAPDPAPVNKPKPAMRTARPAASAASPSIQRPPENKAREESPQRRPTPAPAPTKPYSDDAPYQVTESPGAIRTSYAKCQRLPSLFERERCAWQVCNKKWGKDGCPSFDHKTPPGIGGTAIAEDYMAGRIPNAAIRPGSPARLA